MAHIKEKSGLARAFKRAYSRKWSFLGVFALVFLASFSLLDSMGLTPEAGEKTAVTPRQAASAINALSVEEPTRVEIPAIDLEVAVVNPKSTEVSVLDAALLKGAVRYPTSAKLGEAGNTVLFGHSSYLPIVHNRAYKAFNAIQELEKGDRITVYGNGHAYVYAVDTVQEADADVDAIPLPAAGHTLTLVTCDSFASKSDRFIVTATLVESYPEAT
ncbi:MAG TPA: sortase [Candidatus Paceibacterota bacterium]|nr:sortase [Candidatus Paceibacterota bacterium]